MKKKILSAQMYAYNSDNGDRECTILVSDFGASGGAINVQCGGDAWSANVQLNDNFAGFGKLLKTLTDVKKAAVFFNVKNVVDVKRSIAKFKTLRGFESYKEKSEGKSALSEKWAMQPIDELEYMLPKAFYQYVCNNDFLRYGLSDDPNIENFDNVFVWRIDKKFVSMHKKYFTKFLKEI